MRYSNELAKMLNSDWDGLWKYSDWDGLWKFSDFAPQLVSATEFAVDMIDKDDEIEIHGNLPGVKKENIKIEMEPEFVSISASYDTEVENKEAKKYFIKERKSESIFRKLPLPEGYDYDKDRTTAEFENGVLKIHIQKKNKEEKKQYISIE